MKITSKCVNCNNKFSYDDKSTRGKFCSNKCSGEYKVYQSSLLIEQGKIEQPATLKKYLSNVRGYRCESCSISEWNNKTLALHLDHIDGNSDNNLPSNIRLLCPNCHSQTETFSGRNKKNTKRNTYMQRYRIKKLVGDEGIEPPTLTV